MAGAWYGNENYDPNPNLKIWLDGRIVPVAEAKLSVFDHGLLYGDGIFEGIRSYCGRIFECDAHLKRFFRSAKAISLQIPHTYEQIERALEETLAANGLMHPEKDAYIRMVCTRGVGVLGISPRRTWKPQLYIIASTISMYPEEMYQKGMPVIISSVTRNLCNAMPPQVKSLNYLNNILAKIEAHDADVPEAIMLNHQGNVAEATGDNVFIVRNGQLQTPPTSAGILEGITRATIIRLAREAGIEVAERELVRFDLYAADECFLTGTGAQVIPVTRIDRREVGNGKVGGMTRHLMDAYHALVRSPASRSESGAAPQLASGVRG
ncbi:MAG: branched-chain-amino-acid transaminase [Phycisphaerae bacterium]|jgi:branched-chain amino acid aminotransferase|nr:branched-chain-amino-acid transaminase [Phycisphaerae bacterium]MCZ2401488.1 branched-chain-amino-acid transaminase [Phycisphaerae bacterium]NUQ48666.1 branched-chain-amino-acid transaminase [Phycisphaerae bacterium]